jgi:hypothetical protein
MKLGAFGWPALLAMLLVTACGGDDSKPSAQPPGHPDAAGGTGGGAPDAGTSDADSGTVNPDGGGLTALRIELSPPGMILQPGGSSVVIARVLDGSGTPVPAGRLTWEIKGSAVTLTEGPNQTVTLAAATQIGSAQIIARLGNVVSTPITVAVAELVPGARFVPDSEVLSDTTLIDVEQTGDVGAHARVTLANDAPMPGQIIVGSGKRVGGKVVSSSPVQGGNDVVFELVPLDQMFRALSIQESYDAAKMPLDFPIAQPSSVTTNQDGSITYGFVIDVPQVTPLEDTAAFADDTLELDLYATKFRLGPFFCGATATATPAFDTSQLSFTVTPHVNSIDVNVAVGLGFPTIKILAQGKVDAHLKGPIRLNGKLEGTFGCKAPLVTWPIPAPPPLLLIALPAVVAGPKFTANGKILLNVMELLLDAEASQPMKLGFETTSDGSFNNLSELDTSQLEKHIEPKFQNTTGTAPARVDVDLRGGFFANATFTPWLFALAKIAKGDYPYLNMLELDSGLKANLRLGSVEDQANDPNYAAGYDIYFRTSLAVGSDAKKAFGWLSTLLSFGPSLPDLVFEEKLFSSPLGTARTSLTNFLSADHLHFDVALDPDYIAPPLLGYYNVKTIEIWRKIDGGGAEKLASYSAQNGQKDFALDWVANAAGVTKDNLIAVVEPVFGEGFRFKLGPVDGWTGIQQQGGPLDQIGLGLTVDPNGNVAVVGYSFDPLASVPPAGGADAVWQQFSPLGKPAFANAIGGTGDDSPQDVALAPDGSSYMVGYSVGGDLAATGAPPAGVYAWLVKLDATGKKLWARQWATRSREFATSVALGPNGDIYVGGITAEALGGNIAAGWTCPNVLSEFRTNDCGDVVVSRFDPSGNPKPSYLDERKSSQGLATDIAVDSSGNVVLVASGWGDVQTNEMIGNENTDVPLTDPARYKQGMGIWYWDSTGSLTRKFVEIDKKDLIVNRVGFDSSQNIVASGHTEGAFGGFGNNGGFDAFLVRLPPSEVGSTNPPSVIDMFGGAGYDSVLGMAIAPDGKICVTGATTSSLFAPSAGAHDAYLACYSGGARVIARQFGSSAAEGGRDVAFDEYGDIFVSGDTKGKLGAASFGGFDVIVAKFSPGGNPQ